MLRGILAIRPTAKMVYVKYQSAATDQQSIFTARKEHAALVLLSKLRLVSINAAAMPVGLLCQDLRARLLGQSGPSVFDNFFCKANQDKPSEVHVECVATIRHVQCLS